jgi:excisionase family DNA binding protein
MQNKNELISVKEAAEITGYSRMHIVRLINDGKIIANKVGRSYVVDRNSLGGIFKKITPKEEKNIDHLMNKVIKDYGPALKRLSKE